MKRLPIYLLISSGRWLPRYTVQENDCKNLDEIQDRVEENKNVLIVLPNR